MSKKIIYLATGNAHKVEEFSQIFENTNFSVLSAKELGGMPYANECEDTFKGNALIKAKVLKSIAPKDAYVLADDSGIVVNALNGAPGVHSARYAGIDGNNADTENNKKLLREMQGVEDRSASFVCVLALISPDNTEVFFEGKVDGFIIEEEKGEKGFGYDPLFLYKEFNQTTAQIDSALKHKISHRGKASRALVEYLTKE